MFALGYSQHCDKLHVKGHSFLSLHWAVLSTTANLGGRCEDMDNYLLMWPREKTQERAYKQVTKPSRLTAWESLSYFIQERAKRTNYIENT